MIYTVYHLVREHQDIYIRYLELGAFQGPFFDVLSVLF